jgi:PAS domain S-box-containing protein
VESFRLLVEHGPDAVARFDSDLRITYANPAMERVTGTLAGSLIGTTSSQLGIRASLISNWELVLHQAWRTGREQVFEVTLDTPTGERMFDSRLVPELGPDGSVQSLLTVCRDVTDQRRAETERSALYQQLVAQHNQVQDLMARLVQDRDRTIELTAAVAQFELTDRERQILRLLASGWTNREIGEEIGLKTGTVKNHVARILSKLNAADRTHAAARAVELGLVGSTE